MQRVARYGIISTRRCTYSNMYNVLVGVWVCVYISLSNYTTGNIVPGGKWYLILVLVLTSNRFA